MSRHRRPASEEEMEWRDRIARARLSGFIAGMACVVALWYVALIWL